MNFGQAVTPMHVVSERNRLQALELREAGAKYRQIAEKLNVSVGRAHQYVMEAIAELHEQVLESAEQVKLLELNRLDAMWMRLSARKDNDSPRVVEAMLRIMERRARLLGLDAPVEIGGPGGGPIPVAPSDAREVLEGKVEDMFRRLRAGESVGAIVDTLKPAEDGGAGNGTTPSSNGASTNGQHG